jgi:hypothetical protein
VKKLSGMAQSLDGIEEERAVQSALAFFSVHKRFPGLFREAERDFDLQPFI